MGKTYRREKPPKKERKIINYLDSVTPEEEEYIFEGDDEYPLEEFLHQQEKLRNRVREKKNA